MLLSSSIHLLWSSHNHSDSSGHGLRDNSRRVHDGLPFFEVLEATALHTVAECDATTGATADEEEEDDEDNRAGSTGAALVCFAETAATTASRKFHLEAVSARRTFAKPLRDTAVIAAVPALAVITIAGDRRTDQRQSRINDGLASYV